MKESGASGPEKQMEHDSLDARTPGIDAAVQALGSAYPWLSEASIKRILGLPLESDLGIHIPQRLNSNDSEASK